ncbi:MAG: peptide ABC transporter substrate-binding protein [Anaerolineae bacterium]|nr:peptide ABC transporter substrate-binding protein [Anaerolineae bacterium]
MLAKHSSFLWLFLLLTGLTACTQELSTEIVTVMVTRPPTEITRLVTERVTVPVTITPSPDAVSGTPAPKQLTVCLVTEPQSLYWYDAPPFGAAAHSQTAILHAIYENPFTSRQYSYQPQGLQKLPSLADGDAVLVPVIVSAGALAVDSQNRIVTVQTGTRLRHANGQEIIFNGEAVPLLQMQVQFTFRPLVWSDGQPVTAQDSVFSYKVARDPNTPADKRKISYTASYLALNDHTVEWRGLPGWLDPLYFTNVWMPLPAHQLAGLTAADLLLAPETTRTPLSSGPFVITEWLPGQQIKLIRNEHYYRRDEGFPRLDQLTFRFVGSSDQLLALLLAGECHIGTQDGLDLPQASTIQDAAARELLIPYFTPSMVFEHLDFGINSAADYASKRPDWFESSQIRQAIAHCTDRTTMAEVILYGLGQVSHLFVPPDHPLIPDDIAQWPYDVAAANAILEELGYRDYNGDGFRQHPRSGRTFRVTLGISRNNPTQQRLGELLVSNLAKCGLDVQLTPHSPAEWFAPQGPLFGRRFDLAIFPWITDLTPACVFYTTAAIPDENNNWQGNNQTGWSNPAFDTACTQARQQYWGSDPYAAAIQETFHLFAQDIPSLPLFHYLRLAVTHPSVRHFQPDTTQPSELWNLYELDRLESP